MATAEADKVRVRGWAVRERSCTTVLGLEGQDREASIVREVGIEQNE